MPAPSSIQPRNPTAGDVFLDLHRHRDGEPGVGVVYGPADYVGPDGNVVPDAASAALNQAGQPMVRRWAGSEYSISLSMSDPLARDRLIAMEFRIRDLCQAGKLADDAEATVCYELLDDVRAAGSMTAALEVLGARVFGPGTPFIPNP